LALLYRVKKYPVLEFSFSYEKGVGFKNFFYRVWIPLVFLLNWIKVKYWIVGLLGFSTVNFGNSVLYIGSFWFFLAYLFISLPDIGNSGFSPSSLFTA